MHPFRQVVGRAFDRVIKVLGPNNRLLQWILRIQPKHKTQSIFWQPLGLGEKFIYLYGLVCRRIAKTASFAQPITRTVTYTDTSKALFSISLDITEYTQARYYYRYPDPALRDLIVRGGRTFVDVGANVGIFSLLAANYFDHVVAFEPLPTVLAALERNAAPFINIQVCRKGISDHEGRAIIYQNAMGLGGSSFTLLDPRLRAMTNKANWQHFEVEVLPLDKVLGDIDQIDLLKVDVEGHEVEAIAGAIGTIQKNQPVIFIEIHDQERFRDVCSMLPRGFNVLDPLRGVLMDACPYPDTVFFWDNQRDLVEAVFPRAHR